MGARAAVVFCCTCFAAPALAYPDIRKCRFCDPATYERVMRKQPSRMRELFQDAAGNPRKPPRQPRRSADGILRASWESGIAFDDGLR